MGKPSDDSDNPDRARAWSSRVFTRSQPSQRTPDATSTIHDRSALSDSSEGTAGKIHDNSQHQDGESLDEKRPPHGRGRPTLKSRDKNDPMLESSSTTTSATPESKDEGKTDTTVKKKAKGPIKQRLRAGLIRFALHTKDALTHSWFNVLLVFVPAGIIMETTHQAPVIIFAINAIAIIPLAGLLVYATESVAARLGDTLGALLNVSFGNAVELILYIIALTKGEIRIVQASLIGSILSNLLLILGMAFAAGGLRFREQVYNSTVTQMSACLLSLSVSSLLLPTAFHASFSDSAVADFNTLKISRATSIVLLIIYIMYLLFQLKSHSYLYESTPQHIIDEESVPGILADMLDSSSSSDSSSGSSDSDSDTSGSHTTTKRIKRAFRNRRRRKSSASSTNTTSVPSVVSSPSWERTNSITDPPPPMYGLPSRRPSVLGSLAGGEDADADLQRRGNGQPLIRDFVEKLNAEHGHDKRSKKQKKKYSKRRHRKHHLEVKVEEETTSARQLEKRPTGEKSTQSPQVEFADDIEIVGQGTENAPRKSYRLRQLQAQSLRPTLSKMLTQNVFVTPPAGASPAATPPIIPRSVSRTGAHVLRRTNSLPDRLNRSAPPAISRQVSQNPVGVTAADAVAGQRNDDEPHTLMSRTASAVLLLITTGLVAVCAEFLVGAIPGMLEASPNVSQEFIGLIILPIVSNAAEHFTAVTVATKNKMDLSIGVSVGSSIQIALFVTPFIVVLGWCIGQPMTLYFNIFETLSLFVTVFVVNFLVLDGRSNYLEGALLMAAYTIIAVAAFFYPNNLNQSTIGGGE